MQSWTSANPHAIIAGVSVSCVASRPGYPVHPVHPCSIYSPSRLIFPVAGLGCAQRPDSQSASRAAASGPINPLPWVAAQFPCDAAAGRSGSRRWARLCQCCAGGTPALPGGFHPVTSSHPRRSIVLRGSSCNFVDNSFKNAVDPFPDPVRFTFIAGLAKIPALVWFNCLSLQGSAERFGRQLEGRSEQ